ncbi:MAG: sugar transporter permease [Paenibacillus sp.]|jgi:putative aldouronate transport system permease protein|nr:sugar transporter permease [Paenibacillus sp.]
MNKPRMKAVTTEGEGVRQLVTGTKAAASIPATVKRRTPWKLIMVKTLMRWQLYLLLLPTLIYLILFEYGPMYGLIIAFKDFNPVDGILNSPWAGLEHFKEFFHSFMFSTILKNTIEIALYEMALFPIPLVMALLLNQITKKSFQRFIQTVTYAPHFISMVVLVGMMSLFFSPRTGAVNLLLIKLGFHPINFMAEPGLFKSLFVWSNIWQNAGWGMIIYLAALTSINPELHEAAVMDGASKLQRIRHIDLPGIMPTVLILLILNMGGFMNIGFEKVYLMQNPLNTETSEIIQTHVYKVGLLQAKFSYASAVGLFNNLINFFILLSMNQLAKRLKQTTLW